MSKEKEAAKTEKDGGELSPDEVKFYQQAGEIFGRVHELLPSGRLKMEVFIEPGKMRWMRYTRWVRYTWDDWISGKPWSDSFIVFSDTLIMVSNVEQFSHERFRELSRMHEWHGRKCDHEKLVLKTES